MTTLRDHCWKKKYTPAVGQLLTCFYVPAISCAVRYDRTTGFFSSQALAAASKGVEGLVDNKGKMRMVCGCTLGEQEIRAIQKGLSLKDAVDARLKDIPFEAVDDIQHDGLELLAWMVANDFLEIRLAVPWDLEADSPGADIALFHEKTGILEDAAGNRIAFSGSINETREAWTRNWETFHVFSSWDDGREHLKEDEESFCRLWQNNEPTARVLSIGEALRKKLLAFAPAHGALPRRLRDRPSPEAKNGEKPPLAVSSGSHDKAYNEIWTCIRTSPALSPHGDSVGEATAAVDPWPHQVRAFARMYTHWPPRLLIADEVGLGKTIQAGMLIRQAWLAGRARRILILAPKAVLQQWQLELREKFNLNVPIYDDGELRWSPSPMTAGRQTKKVAFSDWHKEPLVIASSHLMRRRERREQILNEAKAWDLVVLDEAHHARSRGSRDLVAGSPNQLLALMRSLKDRTQGLILLTATPMQVHPLEVWDLLSLLGLPEEWTAENFLQFFATVSHPSPDKTKLAFLAMLFKSMERTFGPIDEQLALRLEPNHKEYAVKKVLRSLREESTIPLGNLSLVQQQYTLRLLKAWNPTTVLISRHTRELLRRYHSQGKLTASIATRKVQDLLVDLTSAERALYEEVEDYISLTYNRASLETRNAIGFVMTIYRRRLASSFHALAMTLRNRLDNLDSATSEDPAAKDLRLRAAENLADESVCDGNGDVMSEDDALALQCEALKAEELDTIRHLLAATRKLPPDSKLQGLLKVIRELQAEGYTQVIVFTQYTDTLDFLRRELGRRDRDASTILCFSGRGGERWSNGVWQPIPSETTKKLFREGKAEILLCTDAAAEGLNFQFCGALVNYDMPWNPMKVEQRIGRIDRLGQRYQTIRIVNLMYRDTVEADIYQALQERISLFDSVVGRLQPILARIPQMFSDFTLNSPTRDSVPTKKHVLDKLDDVIAEQSEPKLSLDDLGDDEFDMPERAQPAYDLNSLNAILEDGSFLPPGCHAERAGARDYKYQLPGMEHPIRVTTDKDFFEEHSQSVELWSPGSPAFPWEKTIG